MAPPIERKNIIVTGGAGFIGSHLCDELVAKSNVICIDNFLTGSEENIHHLLPHPSFKFLRHDLTEPIALERLPELKPFRIDFQGVQEIYHLACPTSPTQYEKFGVETILANGLGTKHALDLARQYRAPLVHLSSSAIYGEPLEPNAFTEDYWGFVDPIGARSSYTEGKRYAEALVVQYRLRYGVHAKILRVFNTYGPRMKLGDGRMLPDFVRAALANEDLVIFGDAHSVSTFNYVTDLLEAMIKTMASSEPGPLNIGNPQPVTMREVAEMVVQLTNSSSRIVYQSPQPWDARQGIPDITRAREKLGWFPVVPLQEGLQRTIEAMKSSRILRLTDVRPTTGL